MTEPRISILVPCFNQGKTLPETVASVQAQTRDDWELLIVDDGSTDASTKALFDDFAPPRSRIFRTENRGLAAARNLLAREARGDYLSALDADDLLAPDFLEKTAAVLDREPSTTFASCWLETFEEESWLWQPERCDLAAVLAECTVATPALVRKEAVLAVEGWDEAMPYPGYEDWDLWISLLAAGARGVILPEVLFRYRRCSDSMSSICCHGQVHLDLMEYLFAKHEDSYREHLDEVLALRDQEIGELLRGNWDLEKRITTWLEPEVERRSEENQRLRQRLDEAEAKRRDANELIELRGRAVAWETERSSLEARVLELDAQKNRFAQEVNDLRSSHSWKWTAPLRKLFALFSGKGSDG